MFSHTTYTDRFIHLGGDMWVRVSQIEGVYRKRSSNGDRAVVRTISGEEYLAEHGISVRKVLDLITKEADDADR